MKERGKMREIKFRARNATLPRCWINGYFVIENDICFIINDEGKFPVIAGTECQYIGLKDKNDKEIYEEDIVKVTDGIETISEIYQVRYFSEQGYPAFDLEPQVDIDSNGLSHYGADGYIEVIGNVHENPGLLKESK